jgi:hypothetical protein
MNIMVHSAKKLPGYMLSLPPTTKRSAMLRYFGEQLKSMRRTIRDSFCELNVMCPTLFAKAYHDVLECAQHTFKPYVIYAETVLGIQDAGSTLVNIEEIVKEACSQELRSRKITCVLQAHIKSFRRSLLTGEAMSFSHSTLEKWSELMTTIGMVTCEASFAFLDTETYSAYGVLPDSRECSSEHYHLALTKMYDIEMIIMFICCKSASVTSLSDHIANLITFAASFETISNIENSAVWRGTTIVSAYFFRDIVKACSEYDKQELRRIRTTVLYQEGHDLYSKGPFTEASADVTICCHISRQLHYELSRLVQNSIREPVSTSELIHVIERIGAIDHTQADNTYAFSYLYRPLKSLNRHKPSFFSQIVERIECHHFPGKLNKAEWFASEWLSRLLKSEKNDNDSRAKCHTFCRAMICSGIVNASVLSSWVGSWKAASLNGSFTNVLSFASTLASYLTDVQKTTCGLVAYLDFTKSVEEASCGVFLHERLQDPSDLADEPINHHAKLQPILLDIKDGYASTYGGSRQVMQFHPYCTMIRIRDSDWSLCIANVLLFVIDSGEGITDEELAGITHENEFDVRSYLAFLVGCAALVNDSGRWSAVPREAFPVNKRFMYYSQRPSKHPRRQEEGRLLEACHKLKANLVRSVKQSPGEMTVEQAQHMFPELEPKEIAALIDNGILEFNCQSKLRLAS